MVLVCNYCQGSQRESNQGLGEPWTISLRVPQTIITETSLYQPLLIWLPNGQGILESTTIQCIPFQSIYGEAQFFMMNWDW
jgi:hypothetical protein